MCWPQYVPMPMRWCTEMSYGRGRKCPLALWWCSYGALFRYECAPDVRAQCTVCHTCIRKNKSASFGEETQQNPRSNAGELLHLTHTTCMYRRTTLQSILIFERGFLSQYNSFQSLLRYRTSGPHRSSRAHLSRNTTLAKKKVTSTCTTGSRDPSVCSRSSVCAMGA